MKLHYQYIVLMVCWFTWFWNMSYRFMIPSLLPAIQRALSLSVGAAGLLLGAIEGGSSVSMLLTGFLCSKLGRKRIIILGIIFSFLCALLTSFMRNFLAIFIMFFLLGLGLGTYAPAGVSLLSEIVPRQKSGFYIAIHETAAPVGQTVGPIFVGLAFILGLDWSKCLQAWIVVAVVSLVSIVVLMREPMSPQPHAYVLQRKKMFTLPDTWTLTTFLLVVTATICQRMGFFFFYMLPMYWTGELKVDMTTAAFILGLTRFSGILGQIGAGYLSDAFGRIKVLIVTNFLTSLLMIGSAYLPFGNILFFICLIAQSAFQTAYYPLLFALISDTTSPLERSKMIGIVIGLGGLTGLIAPTIIGLLADEFGFAVAWVYPIVTSFLSCLFLAFLRGLSVTPPPTHTLQTR